MTAFLSFLLSIDQTVEALSPRSLSSIELLFVCLSFPSLNPFLLSFLIYLSVCLSFDKVFLCSFGWLKSRVDLDNFELVTVHLPLE